MKARNGQIEIEFEVFGIQDAETIVLINGTGSQLTRWPEEFCHLLASRNFRVVRLDNRDTGLSSWVSDEQPYTLSDMSGDVVAVLDTIGVLQAHLVGISMGGMIAQVLAYENPSRVLSLTSIMSNTGNPNLRPPPALAVLTGAGPNPADDLDAFLAHTVANAERISSPGFPWPEGALLSRARSEFTRAFNPAGVKRQLRAIAATGDRREMLRQLRVPTVVVHGPEDPLAVIEGGLETASIIPRAELRLVNGMGHDLSPGLHPIVADAIFRAIELSANARTGQV